MKTINEKIALQIPQFIRGLVWCIVCGRMERVVAAECLRIGWPICCSVTMTIDSPKERTMNHVGARVPDALRHFAIEVDVHMFTSKEGGVK